MSSVWSILAIRRVLSQLQPMRDGRIMSEDVLESCILTLELVHREFVTLGTIGRLSEAEEVSCRCVVGALRLLCQLSDKSDMASVYYTPPATQLPVGRVGRPRFEIRSEQLQYLVENHFTVPQISQLLGVCCQTVEQRLSEYEISIRATYSDVTDAELHRVVAEIQHEHPFCNNRQVRGHVLSRDFRIQQYRIRGRLILRVPL